jgi:hypothetical protein
MRLHRADPAKHVGEGKAAAVPPIMPQSGGSGLVHMALAARRRDVAGAGTRHFVRRAACLPVAPLPGWGA